MRVLDHIASSPSDAEVTVECNPDTVTPELARARTGAAG